MIKAIKLFIYRKLFGDLTKITFPDGVVIEGVVRGPITYQPGRIVLEGHQDYRFVCDATVQGVDYPKKEGA